MKTMALIIGITAVVLVGAVLVMGFHARTSFAHGGGKFMDCMVERFADKLDLTADQREQLTLMAEEAKRKHGEMYSLRMATRAEVMGELRKETIDKAKIDALYDDVKTRFDELYGLFSDRFIAFHRSLTPEQKEKLIAQMEKHHRKRNGFHQRWSNEG